MHVFDFQDYRSFVRHCLENGTAAKPRSTKKSLADHMKCHATFISHVVADKAEFSTEHAVRFCSYYGLDEDSSDYFLDLLARDRAGDVPTREIYDRRLERQRLAWLTLHNRLKSEERLSGEHQRRYFESWLLQLVHLCCMLPGRNTLTAVTDGLGLPSDRIEGALRELTNMGLLEKAGEHYETRPKKIHLDRSSPTFKTCHGNWRVKIAADVAATQEPEGIHYTSAMTISQAAAEQLRKDILDHIAAARDAAVQSDPEEVYILALDLYQVTRTETE
jgi:uncharacterized protein (TIGR02147 family)